MINLSTKARFRLENNQKVLFKADFTLNKEFGRNKDIQKTNLSLTGDDVMGDSATITDATSTSGTFSVGSAIINSFNLTLNNFDDRFSLYDFTGATMKVGLGIPLVDKVTNKDDPNQVEWVQKGYYTVDKPSSIGNTIPLTMLDNMSKFEKPFKDVKVNGNKLSDYINAICLHCNVTLQAQPPHYEWTLSDRPSDEDITCLDMIGYIAQITGCYARINRNGALEFKWYDFAVDGSAELDGGTFITSTTPYSDGDNADGGSFDNVSETIYTTGDNLDGGDFNYSNTLRIGNFKSFSVGTDLITITGIEFTVENLDETSEINSYTYLYDKNGVIRDSETDRKEKARAYCLEIKDNKLLPLMSNLTQCLSYLSAKICGISFYPFNVQTLSNPSYEAGDSVTIISPKGDAYDSVITSLSYPLNGYISLNCDAETPSERNASHSNPLSTAIASVKNDTRKQLSIYEKGAERMNTLSYNALGFYSHSEEDLDGSRIEYMHDRAEFENSLHAYKISSTGFFIGSRAKITDPWTWNEGVDMGGNAVFRTLIAEGIDADKISVTNLEVGKNVTMGANAKISWSNVDNHPTDLGDFTNDVGYATEGQIPTDLGDLSNTKGQYAKESQIPTDLGDLSNTKGQYAKESQIPTDLADLSNTKGQYAKKSEIPSVPDVSGTYVGVKTIYYTDWSYYSASSTGEQTKNPPPKPPTKASDVVNTESYRVWTTNPPEPSYRVNTYAKDGVTPVTYYYNYYFYMCVQYQKKDGTYEWSAVTEYNDSVATTCIAKNNITTSYLNALNITAQNVSATDFYGKNYHVGYNGQEGAIYQYDNTDYNVLKGKWTKDGLELYQEWVNAYYGIHKITNNFNASYINGSDRAFGISMKSTYAEYHDSTTGFNYYLDSELRIANHGFSADIDYVKTGGSYTGDWRLNIGRRTKLVQLGGGSSSDATEYLSISNIYKNNDITLHNNGIRINTEGTLYLDANEIHIWTNGIERTLYTGTFTVGGKQFNVKNGLIYVV